MSVIVKNMEMPDRCGRCFFVRWSNLHQTAWCTLAQEACFEDFSRDYKNRRADFCPLVEIPTPHGRLGDLDKLIDSCKQYMNMLDPESKEYTKIFALKCYLVAVAEEAVIEAEGEICN